MRYLLGFVLSVFITTAVHAALIDRGGQFIYDDVLNITWLQNANAGAGSAYDDGVGMTDGAMSWGNAMAWADTLSIVDSRPGANGTVYDDWRLAYVDVDGDGTVVDCSLAAELACRDNEYGYLFYHYGVSFANPNPFVNVGPQTLPGPSVYWSGNLVTTDLSRAWVFFFDGGFPATGDKNGGTYALAWAVRQGDVALIPLPGAVLLFASALGLLGWTRRKTHAP